MVVMARTKDKNREYMRQYRAKNRKVINARNLLWMRLHRKRLIENIKNDK